MTPPFHRFSVILPLAILTIATPVFAQRAIPIRQRAFDRISVKEGPRLYGAIASRDSQGNITIAVRRAWLKDNSPTFYEAQLKTERSNAN